MNRLALCEGKPLRNKPFMSRPHIDELEHDYINECLSQKMFSRFIGSPVGNFRQLLRMSSREAVQLTDFWSVLGGPFVRKFENEFSKKIGAQYAVSMNSATSCLTAAIIACGLKDGDEVITSPFTFTATATGLHIAGIKIVFADVNPETFCIDQDTIQKVITDRTRAIVPVHILGNAGNIQDIKRFCDNKGFILIEDSAQAIGSSVNGRKLGTFGKIGIFSFQETKNIMTGEGGMAVTDDQDLAHKLRLIRNHGESMVFDDDPFDLQEAAVGYNFRLPEILAAIGFAQAQKLEKINAIRAENYFYLKERLEGFNFIKSQMVTNDKDGFFPYCAGFSYAPEVLGISRDLFARALRAEGVPVATGFPRLLNENLLYKSDTSLTHNAFRLNYETYLGFFQIGYPNILADMDDIVGAIEKVVQNQEELQLMESRCSHEQQPAFNSGRN